MATLVSLESDLANVKDLVNFLIDRRVPFNRIGSTQAAPFDVASPWLVDTVPPSGDAVYANEPIGHYVINVDTGTVWRKVATDSTLTSSWSEFGQGSSGGGGIGEWQDSVLQYVYPVTNATEIEAEVTEIETNGTYDFRYIFIDSASDIDNVAGTAPHNIIYTAGHIYRLEGSLAPVDYTSVSGDDGNRWIAGDTFAEQVIGFDEVSGSYTTPAALTISQNDLITYTFERDASASGNDGFLSFDPTTGSFTSVDEADTASGNDNQIYFYDGTSWNVYVSEETYKIEESLTPLETLPDAYVMRPLMSFDQISKLATPPSDSDLYINGVDQKDDVWETASFDWAGSPVDITADVTGYTATTLTVGPGGANSIFVGDILQINTDVDSYLAVITNFDTTVATPAPEYVSAAPVAGTITTVLKQGLTVSATVSTASVTGNTITDTAHGRSIGDVIYVNLGNTGGRNIRVVTNIVDANNFEYSGPAMALEGGNTYKVLTADYGATTFNANDIATDRYFLMKIRSGADGYIETSNELITPSSFVAGYDLESDDQLTVEYYSPDNS